MKVDVRVVDLPEVQRLLEVSAAEIDALKAERDEWEERYEWLLAQCGGTAPG
jgi:hypothetical protein